MISRHLRFAFLGALMGLVVALVPGCQKKCAPDNCTGCCSDKNECVTTADVTACGLAGAACSACGADQACTDGACVDLVNPNDAGVVDAGPPPCTNDFDCRSFGNGSICDVGSGVCSPGLGCTIDADCQSLDPDNRCYRYGQQCVCDQTDAPAGNANWTGTCRLRKSSCEECTSDTECGNDVVIFGPPDGIGAGRCKTLPNDMSGKKFCFYQQVGQCPCGTINDGTGFCRPQSNSCEQVGCNIDKDCPSGAVCSVNRPDAGVGSCGGICVPRCRWDFGTRDNVAPGCAPGQTCWVDSQNLNPTSIYYGAGRCKPPCETDADCRQSDGNPFGGTNLKCAAEKLPDGTMSAKRCRAAGECMDNAECPALPDDQPYLGYCDRGAFTCETDCRPGQDPVTALPYKDCRPPYACTADGGTNYCRLETCVEQGGAEIACAQGEYCCGDDKNFDGIADPCPPVAEQNAAGCYKAPKPPFCTPCYAAKPLNGQITTDDVKMADAECAALTPPSWATCTNGSKSPNCSQLKFKCEYAGDRGMSTGINVCMPPSVNDIGTVPGRYGDRRKTIIACPTNYTTQWVRPQPNPTQDDYCQTNDDCKGSSDAGFCETDTELRLQDGGYGKSCRCDVGSGAAQCPNGMVNGRDVSSFCKSGVTGARTYCIETAICTPPRGSVYKPTTEFGCGL